MPFRQWNHVVRTLPISIVVPANMPELQIFRFQAVSTCLFWNFRIPALNCGLPTTLSSKSNLVANIRYVSRTLLKKARAPLTIGSLQENNSVTLFSSSSWFDTSSTFLSCSWLKRRNSTSSSHNSGKYSRKQLCRCNISNFEVHLVNSRFQWKSCSLRTSP